MELSYLKEFIVLSYFEPSAGSFSDVNYLTGFNNEPFINIVHITYLRNLYNDYTSF